MYTKQYIIRKYYTRLVIILFKIFSVSGQSQKKIVNEMDAACDVFMQPMGPAFCALLTNDQNKLFWAPNGTYEEVGSTKTAPEFKKMCESATCLCRQNDLIPTKNEWKADDICPLGEEAEKKWKCDFNCVNDFNATMEFMFENNLTTTQDHGMEGAMLPGICPGTFTPCFGSENKELVCGPAFTPIAPPVSAGASANDGIGASLMLGFVFSKLFKF